MEFLAVCILLFIILFIYVQNRDNKQPDDSSSTEVPKYTPDNSESFRSTGEIDLTESVGKNVKSSGSNPSKRSLVLPITNAECRRKVNLFRETVRNEIISVQDKMLPSCEDIIMAKLDSEIKTHINEFDGWPDDTDYSKVSISNLYNITFDMVVSGHYHLYRGILKPDGQQLRIICSKCLDKANRNGYITTEQMKEQLLVLQESIQEVG